MSYYLNVTQMEKEGLFVPEKKRPCGRPIYLLLAPGAAWGPGHVTALTLLLLLYHLGGNSLTHRAMEVIIFQPKTQVQFTNTVTVTYSKSNDYFWIIHFTVPSSSSDSWEHRTTQVKPNLNINADKSVFMSQDVFILNRC